MDARWPGDDRSVPKGMMAPQQKVRKQPQDPYAQRGKKLTSAAQRLRGWVGSDPTRNVELANALVELNAHRLLGHDYAAAAPDARDALRRSAELLTASGPIGPYTSAEDAVRYITAAVHLAATQAGLGLPESAGRTIASVDEVLEQLTELPLQERLDPMTAIWALSCSARSGLASGDVSAANAYADAALARLAESGLSADPDSCYLVIDTDRLASDSRWAAGRPEESLGFLHEAKEQYDQVVDGRLREPAGLSPALLARLAEPLFGVYRDMADRLVASGEVDLGLVTRRELVALLRGLVGRLGQPGQVQLASALTDLADDLLTSDRVEEADAATSEAAETMPDSPGAGSTRLLVASIRARVLTRTDRGGEAVPMLRNVISADRSDSPSAARAVALLALGEALRSAEEAESAAAAAQEFDQLARDLLGTSIEGNDAHSALQDAARGVVRRGGWLKSWEPLPMSASYAVTTARSASAEMAAPRTERDETAAWLQAERDEAHRLELERLEQARVEAARREAEQAKAERTAAERVAEERARAELAERAEAERRVAAEAAERAERKRRREERLEEHRLEVERREAERREAEQQETERQAAAVSGTDPAEAEREELERIQRELAELERAEELARAEHAEAEREAAQAEAVRQAAQAEAERESEAARAEAARLEAARKASQAEAAREAAQAEAEPVEAEQADEPDREAAQEDELAVALGEWRETRARGDRRGARAANERVVDLLRPRAQTDMAIYGSQLLEALEELSRARLRSGDVWGSRAPAKEAKALAKTLSR